MLEYMDILVESISKSVAKLKIEEVRNYLYLCCSKASYWSSRSSTEIQFFIHTQTRVSFHQFAWRPNLHRFYLKEIQILIGALGVTEKRPKKKCNGVTYFTW